jgi:hypothetical protein
VRPRLLVATLVGLMSLLSLTPPALAASAEDVAGDIVAGVYVDEGLDADTADLQRLVGEAAAGGFDLSLVVVADETVDAVTFASVVGARLGGTVLVLTPAQYGVWSEEMSGEELDRIIGEAQGALSGPVVTDGAAAFVAALGVASEPDDSVDFWLIVGVGALVIGLIGVAGGIWQRRSSSERRRRSVARTWDDLRTRADAHGDSIRALSAPVELLHDDDATDTCREASRLYDRVRRTLEREPDADRVGEVGRDVNRLDDLMARLGRMTSDTSTTGLE